MGNRKGPTKSKKRKKKSTKRSDGSADVQQKQPVVKPWSEEVKEEIQKMESIVSDGWIALTLAKARWVNFNVDPKIREAFGSPVGQNKEQVLEWVRKAESSIVQWVLRERILKDNHVDEFRCLGRGWIFVLLRRPEKKFKFWFESVKRIEHDHTMDLQSLNLEGEKLNKHTFGYMFESEMVFFIKGLVNGSGTQPTISIQKLHPGYKDLAKWATNDQLMNACKREDLATDDERKLIAAKTMKRQKQKLRSKRERREQDAQQEYGNADSQSMGSGDSALGDEGTTIQSVWKSDFERMFGTDDDSERVTRAVNSWFHCLHHRRTPGKLRLDVEKGGIVDPGARLCSCAEPTMYASVAKALKYKYKASASTLSVTGDDGMEQMESEFDKLLRQFKAEDSRFRTSESAFF